MYKAGDVVKFKGKEYTDTIHVINFKTCGWNKYGEMNYLWGQERVLTEEMAKIMNTHAHIIWHETDKNGKVWYISPDMIELVP